MNVIYEKEAQIGNISILRFRIADKLKFLDPMYTTREGEMKDMGDPEWLIEFKSVLDQQLYSSSSMSQHMESSETSSLQQQPDQQQQQVYYDDQGDFQI